MKKVNLTTTLLCFAILAFAQVDIDLNKLDKSAMGKVPTAPIGVCEFSPKMSNQTGMLFGELTEKKRIARAKQKSVGAVVRADSTMMKRYLLRTHNEVCYVSAFVELENTDDTEALDALGVKHIKLWGDIFVCQIPVEVLGDLADDDNVKRIEISQRVYPMLDNARSETNAEMVYAGTNLPHEFTGKGVVVGIIDVGFDFTHPNFYSIDKSEYRIKCVWDQTSTAGAPVYIAGNKVELGSEFTTKAKIISHKSDNTSGSHATHVTGIAAGSGCIANSKYRGVAPEADIVAVAKNTTDYGIVMGIGYILEYAANQGKNCVINMSLGYHLGAHDGTSQTAQLFKEVTEAYKNNGIGVVLVGAAGNEGGDKIHYSKTFSSTDNLALNAVSSSSGATDIHCKIDLWSDAPFGISGGILNINTKEIENSTQFVWTSSTAKTVNYTIEDKDPILKDKCKFTITTQQEAANGKYHATVAIDNTDQDDSYRYACLAIESYSGVLHAWIDYNPVSDLDYPSVIFANGDTDYTVGEVGGISEGIISVGAYTTKNQWESISQGTQNAGYYTSIGKIAPFSSLGPTVDGRMKPDIAAPGNVVVSSVNSFDTEHYGANGKKTVASYTNNGQTHYFGSMQGTSMASPFVAGVVATWLQADPMLNTYEVRDILRSTARRDSYTGSAPNNTWGYGKIDAYAGLVEVIRRRAKREAENNRNFVIVAKRETGNYFYMTSNLYKNKRFNATNTGTTDLTKIVTENVPDSLVWTCDLRGTTTKLQHGTQYVSWKSGNTAILDATGRELTIDGGLGYTFLFADTDSTTRMLALNATAGNDYFAFYREGQMATLYLLPCTTASSDDTRTCAALPFGETFASSSQGQFTAYDVITAQYDQQTWKPTDKYGMKIGGQVSGANKAAESWLISPCIDLSGTQKPQLTFDHTHRYAGTPAKEFTLWISTDYTTGAPSSATWEQLTIPKYGTNNDWNFVSSTAIDLSQYTGQKVCLAWKYTSSTSAAGVWEVKNVSVAEVTTTANKVVDSEKIIVFGIPSEIAIFGLQAGQRIEVYSTTGVLLCTKNATSDFISLPMPSGFYIVKVGNTIQKVSVSN